MRKTLEGIIMKLSSKNTIVVSVERKFPHPKYKKIIKRTKKYLVHDDGSIEGVKVGAKVLIQETIPISKRKTWKLVEILG